MDGWQLVWTTIATVHRALCRTDGDERLFITACSMDDHYKEKRTEQNLTVHNSKSEAEVTNNIKCARVIVLLKLLTDKTRNFARPLSLRVCSWSCVSTMFVAVAPVRENGDIYRYGTFSIDRQWYWYHANKFATWQHPAMGCMQFVIFSFYSYIRLICLPFIVFTLNVMHCVL